MTAQLIDRVRKLVTDGGMSRSGLARAAGLHANTLRDLTDPAWNPTADTLGKARVDQLGLELMSRNNGTRHETAFTVSIEAREGVTTGISAGDRARTVAVAIDATKGRQDIVSPGHVFPLIAREGGVLVRAGHTEASVDISRLAGLNPAGVICEIMNEDGTMARMDDLVPFARRHGLKMGTIRDLIEYRRKHDHLVEKINEVPFTSDYGGQWKLITFRNKVDGTDSFVLQKGEIDPAQPTLVRVHTLSILDDMLGQPGPRKRTLQRAMGVIGEHGSGLIVLLVRPREGGDEAGGGTAPDMDLRSYGIGAQILSDMGVHEMVLLSNAHRNVVAIEGYGLNIVGERAIPSE